MKSTKKLIAAIMIALAARGAFAVADSYLYWMVDGSVYNLISGEATTYDYVKVSTDNGTTYLNWYQYDSSVGYSDSFGDVMYVGDNNATAKAYWGVFDYAPGMSFLFELYNDDGTVAGFLNTPWVSSSSIANGSDQSGLTAYTLTGVVPEPTSGLLSLFGLAVLALRRRKLA